MPSTTLELFAYDNIKISKYPGPNIKTGTHIFSQGCRHFWKLKYVFCKTFISDLLVFTNFKVLKVKLKHLRVDFCAFLCLLGLQLSNVCVYVCACVSSYFLFFILCKLRLGLHHVILSQLAILYEQLLKSFSCVLNECKCLLVRIW